MATEPRDPDDWEVLQTYGSASEAEVNAGYLRSEGVAAKLRLLGDILDKDNGVQLQVYSTLVYLARGLLNFDTVNITVIEYLVIGSLATVKESIPETKPSSMSAWVTTAVLRLAA